MTGDGLARILVIKHGGLGDFALALGPAAAIRRRHRDAHVTLLTRPFLAPFAERSGYFDAVWVDHGPKFWQPGRIAGLRRRLLDARFDRVYDLQTSTRSSLYFHLMVPCQPEWSGIARGCSHPHDDAGRDALHTIERQAGQLRRAGIEEVPFPDLAWAVGDLRRFALPPRFVLLAPGGAPHRPEKRWPAASFAALAGLFARQGLEPVLIGAAADRDATGEIRSHRPEAVDLTGETTHADIASLGRAAVGAVGNDTGPMHLVALVGCPSVVLFSRDSDPRLAAPRAPPGRPPVTVLQRSRLADLAVAEVAAASLFAV